MCGAKKGGSLAAATHLTHQALLPRLPSIPVNGLDLLELDAVLADGRSAVHDEIALASVVQDGGLRALALERLRGLRRLNKRREGDWC